MTEGVDRHEQDRHHRQVDHDGQDDGKDDGGEPGGERKVEAFSADVGILVPTKATEVERLA